MVSAKDIIKGAVDMHIHSGPSLVNRSIDHVQAVQEAIEAGMRAIVIKDQHVPCANIAQILQQYYVKDGQAFNVFGSVALNNTAGGVNPRVVEAAIGYEVKVIWMPTLASAYHKEQHAKVSEEARRAMPKPKFPLSKDPAITIVDSFGKLIPEVSEICKLVAGANIAIATGHISREETYLFLDEAVKQGVKKIIVTHPEYFKNFTLDEMRDFVKSGFYVEHILATVYSNKQTHEDLYKLIQNHGTERTIISSDLGQPGRPHPVDGLLAFLEKMLEFGMTEDQLRQITSKNQMELLGIN